MTFLNFEIDKLLVLNSNFSNMLILLSLFLIAIATVKHNTIKILDRFQTEQLKGIAILFVVTGHLWTHVSLENATPNFAANAVALFLVLSGYGLTRSWLEKPLTFSGFISRRLSRVMVPYWLATIVILLLDYLILSKQYSAGQILSTLVGINFDQSVRYLDYARWYITLLLLFYVVFYFLNQNLGPRQAVVGLFVSSLCLFALRRIDWFPFGALYQFIAFPLGCLLGITHERLSVLLSKSRSLLIVMFLSVAGIVFCKLILNWPFERNVEKIAHLLAVNGKPLFYCSFILCIVAIWGSYGRYSRFLTFCGGVSYEVYLIHGPLLIKYNFIFGLFSTDYLVFSYLVLLFGILTVSYLFKFFHLYLISKMSRLYHL